MWTPNQVVSTSNIIVLKHYPLFQRGAPWHYNEQFLRELWFSCDVSSDITVLDLVPHTHTMYTHEPVAPTSICHTPSTRSRLSECANSPCWVNDLKHLKRWHSESLRLLWSAHMDLKRKKKHLHWERAPLNWFYPFFA